MKKEKVRVTMFVSDCDLAIDFYCNKTQLFSLSFDTDFGAFRYIVAEFMHNETFEIQFIEKESYKPEPCQLGEGHFGFCVPEVEQTIQHFKKQNICFESVEAPTGTQIQLKDPFGYELCLSEDIHN